jgi:integrase
LVTAEAFNEIQKVGPGRVFGTRTELWLTIKQVEKFLAIPDRTSYWGKRDACILSLMVGCGLRRAEMASLRWDRYQLREGRMWLDIIGKNHKPRTLPVPTWAQADTDAWHLATRQPQAKCEYSLQHLERTRPRNHEYIAGGLSGDGVHALVQKYGKELGHNLTPCDLRRATAHLLRRAGAALEQIQYTLGHRNIATTVIFMWTRLALLPGLATVDVHRISRAGLSLDIEDVLLAALEEERRWCRRVQSGSDDAQVGI